MRTNRSRASGTLASPSSCEPITLMPNSASRRSTACDTEGGMVVDRDPVLGIGGGVLLDHVRQIARANGGNAGDGHRAAHRLARLADIGEGGLELGEQALRARQEVPAGARELDRSGRALDELHAEIRV